MNQESEITSQWGQRETLRWRETERWGATETEREKGKTGDLEGETCLT